MQKARDHRVDISSACADERHAKLQFGLVLDFNNSSSRFDSANRVMNTLVRLHRVVQVFLVFGKN